jgi:hypothetical protein
MRVLTEVMTDTAVPAATIVSRILICSVTLLRTMKVILVLTIMINLPQCGRCLVRVTVLPIRHLKFLVGGEDDLKKKAGILYLCKILPLLSSSVHHDRIVGHLLRTFNLLNSSSDTTSLYAKLLLWSQLHDMDEPFKRHLCLKYRQMISNIRIRI